MSSDLAQDFDLFVDSPNPLDAVENVLTSYELDFTRTDDDELIINVTGENAAYQILLYWQDDYEALQVTCQIPLPINDETRDNLARLLMAANAKLWLGHFEMMDDISVQFRYTAMIRSAIAASGMEYLNDLFKLAVAECDWFYPALKMLQDQGTLSASDMAFALQDAVGKG